MTIAALGNTVDKDKCQERLLECREWIDEELQKSIDVSNADIETKKLIGDISSKLIVYIQECTTATFNFTNTVTKD